MKTSLAMLLAGLIAAGAWIALEPGMNGPERPRPKLEGEALTLRASPAASSAPNAAHSP